MKITVYRFDPEHDKEPHYDEFQAPITPADRMTVMDVLEYLFEHNDSSLGFYSHSVCNHGICGRCSVRINGKVKLACTTLADCDELLLEPASNEVIKDLVVNR